MVAGYVPCAGEAKVMVMVLPCCASAGVMVVASRVKARCRSSRVSVMSSCRWLARSWKVAVVVPWM